ncbi:two-partner secretion domain-containing protein [Burkholderia catarinensis]|uniref:two-partner secretion domain-containing protein n=1 Tax=Burkholderia catarinensis TaxID=1108140 RepID=UPI001C5874D6|nr:GLUG motif-containing protein [Burkholderia catarinensis]KAG8149240.1 filamentous hemagglutinin [Burkholderia catarinensis]
MNNTYGLVWNDARQCWCAVGETARRNGKQSSGGKRLIAAAASLLGLVATGAHALPFGVLDMKGDADISKSADNKSMLIHQKSDKLLTNWWTFGVARDERVSFQQPTDKSIALNRVIGPHMTEIQGKLDANGRVFLVNPNGVVFGKGAQVNVGGLVATTRNISDEDFLNGKYRFSGTSQRAVVNEGTITAAEGGSVALLGAQVSNSGTIQAKLGRVALGAGNTMTVNFDGNGLLNLQVDDGAVDAQVHNGGLLKADGGEVLMTARAAGDLLGAVVSNTGTIEAKGLNSRSGKITLEGGLVKVAGKLDASAQGADASGGVVTTRGERVEVANDVQVDTRAAGGRTGTWKIEAANGGVGGAAGTGDAIRAATLARTLGTTNVELANTKGSLTVGEAVAWSGDGKLTLTSRKGDVDLKQALDASGTNAGLTVNAAKQIRLHDKVMLTGRNAHLELNAGNGRTLTNPKAVVTLSGENASFRANGEDYTVIRDLAGLRNVDAKLGGRYVLGAAIKGSGRFRSIGGSEAFAGVFDGLGNTISGLSIHNDGPYVGLFGSNFGRIENLNLQAVSVRGDGYGMVGTLVGLNGGTISHVTARDVRATGGGSLGGLVGANLGTGVIEHVSLTGRVDGGAYTSRIGGLVGANLAGPNGEQGTIADSVADTQVSVAASGRAVLLEGAGGLVGVNLGRITRSSSAGHVGTSEAGATLGGLVGRNGGLIEHASSTATVVAGSGWSDAGGLVGMNTGIVIDSSASGDVSSLYGASAIGGLVGRNRGVVRASQASGNVYSNGGDMIGGLVGWNLGIVDASSSAAYVKSAYGAGQVGGLVGRNSGKVTDSHATGQVDAGKGAIAGGLVGYNDRDGVIEQSSASGNVFGADASEVGGLVGRNAGRIAGSSAGGTAKGGPGATVGALVGVDDGGTLTGNAVGGGAARLPAVGGRALAMR